MGEREANNSEFFKLNLFSRRTVCIFYVNDIIFIDLTRVLGQWHEIPGSYHEDQKSYVINVTGFFLRLLKHNVPVTMESVEFM